MMFEIDIRIAIRFLAGVIGFAGIIGLPFMV
jgi:hypothetical protein